MFSRQGADGVPADRRRRQRLLHAQQRRHLPARRRHRQGEVEEPDREAVGDLAGVLGRRACSSRSLSGKVTALRARNGKVLWQKELGSRTESSPIVRRGVVYFGTEGGDLYALFAKTGRVKWKFNASGAIKASPALSGSTLYVGDYSGRMYAVWAKTGRERWSTGTSGSTVRVRGRATSTRRPRSTSGASTPATRTGRCTRSARRTGDARLVALDRRLRLLLPRGRERAGHQADRLRRLLRRQHVRARRAHRLHALDRAAAAGASRAALRSSAASSTSPTSTPRRRTASTRATASCVFKRSRGVLQPGRLRRQAPLHDRLRSVTALDPVKKPGAKAGR